ncbi:retrovirus-related pol polyprotein from transposon TNT 1-94 [Tanacetum coccineum]
MRQPRNDKKTFQRSRDDKNGKSNRKCFRCGDPNHLIGECPKPPKDKNQRAFVGGSWSDRGEEDDERVNNETCLVAQASSEICLGVDLEPDEWIKVSGCSKHMTGNRKLFSSYKAYNGGNVIFGSNLRGIVRNLPKLKFDQHFCDACKIGKQAHASHKAKNMVLMTRCLELLHMDLFGPSAIRSYEGNHYTLVTVDDYSREFDNEVQFGEFCNANGITHNFSAPRTPQSNGVVERKNRTLQEMSYSQNSKACIILNKHTRKVEESLNVTFDETPPPSKTSPLVDDDLDEEEAIKVTEKKNLESDIMDETLEIDKIVNIKESRNHPLENVIGNLNQRTLRSQAQNQSNFFCFISTIEPKNVNEALTDDSWIVAMQEELNQFIANDVWELVPQPRNMTIIGTKWVFRNKLDENGIVSRNKARLVAQGYNQQEGIDYDETYAPVARLESIRILLAYACALDFKLFQMDVKSAFLNSFINKEVYVAQPLRFINFEKPDHVYKLKKALYGLKQAPKAWYDKLKSFLIKHEYKMGMVDNTLFTKKRSSNLIIVQIYVDDIIFGSTCQDMFDEFVKIMHDEFEMSMMGELNFFLGLQIKQMEDGIFFNQSKYIKEMLKKFGLEEYKPMKTPMSSDTKFTKDEECTTHLGLWYPKGTGIETVVYVDSDHAGDYVDRKSTSGICTFMGCCLTSWFSKKQTALAIPTTEAEYISARKACQQALWVKQALIDYDGACVFTDRWSLDELVYGTPSEGLYQTNLPSLDDIISYIREDREGQVTRIRHQEEVKSYILYDRVMNPLAAQQERKPRKDRGTIRGHHSTSSSSAFDQPSSSHLNDDDDDGNGEGTSRASTPSPIRYVNSLTNQVPQVFQNPPNIDPHLEPFYTRQTEIINRQVQIRDEHRGGLRSIGKASEICGEISRSEKYGNMIHDEIELTAKGNIGNFFCTGFTENQEELEKFPDSRERPP